MSYPPERVWELLVNYRHDMLDAADDPEAVGQFELHKLTLPLFTELHPSGFQAQGFDFWVNHHRVAETIGNPGLEMGDEYVQCIADWLWGSTLDQAEGWSPEIAVISFIDRRPTEATMLGAVAQSYGFTLHQWLIGLPLSPERRQEMTAKLLERPPHPEDPT